MLHRPFEFSLTDRTLANTVALNTKDPWFEAVRRHKPSLKGSQAGPILVLDPSQDKWMDCVGKGNCQIKYLDLSAEATPWEIREKPKLKLNCLDHSLLSHDYLT